MRVSDPVDFVDVIVYLAGLDHITSSPSFRSRGTSLVARLWTFSRMLQSLLVWSDQTTAAYSR